MSEDNPNQRYRGMFDWWRFNAGAQKELVFSPLTQSTHLLSDGAMRMLLACKEMGTLDAHASRLCVQSGAGPFQLPAIRRVLGDLVDAGLLVSYEHLCGQLTKHALADDVPGKISSLGIPTKNRPEALKRCLDSYAECAKQYGRDDLKFLIMDQSTDAKSQQANQHTAETAREKYGIDCQYLSTVDAENFARVLCEHSDVAPEVVHFALVNDLNLPLTLGLSRNLLLLNTTGELTMQVDDDTICSVAPCRESDDSLKLTSEYAPQQFWFLSESETSSLGEEGFASDDFFALHEQLLGRSITSCIEGSSGQLNVDEITCDFFRRLSKGESRVAITSVGVAGESGMDGSWFLLMLESKSRQRLMRSENDYRYALNSHQVLRGVTSPTISSGYLIPGHNHGFDNRHFLPPFFPLWRGEDLAFGDLLNLSPLGTFNGYIPGHVLHKPFVTRHYPCDHLRMRVTRHGLCALVQALIQSFNLQRERSPEKTVEALGKSLVEWGRVPLADFEEMLTLLLVRRASLQMLKMESDLKQYNGLPDYWAADMKMCIDAMRETVPQKKYIVSRELEEHYGLEEARKEQQILVRRFGELLLSWSAIREAAADVRARGLQLVK